MNKLISLLIAASLLAGTATAADLTDTRALSGKNTLTVGNVVLTGTDATLLYTMAITGTTGYVKKVTFPNFLDFAGMGPTDSVTFGGITTTTGSISGTLSVGSLTVGGSPLSTIATDTASNGYFQFDPAGVTFAVLSPTNASGLFEHDGTNFRIYGASGAGPRSLTYNSAANHALDLGGLRIAVFGATTVTTGRVVYADSQQRLLSANATLTEAGYLSGVTSAIQTQLDAKQAALTATSAITLGGLISTTIDVSGLARLGTLSVTNGIATGTLSVSGSIVTPSLQINGNATGTGLLQFATGSFTTSISSPVAALTSLVSTSATVSTLTLSGATVNRSVVTGTGGVLSAGALLHSTDDVKLIGTSTLGLYSGSATFAQVYSGANRGLSLAANNGNGVNGLYLGGDSLAYVGLGTVTPSSGFDNNRSVALGAIQNLAADTTLTPANVAYCATLTGAITATLASPANIPRREIYFINVGSVTATLAAPAGGNIMGNTTLSIPAGGNISVISATVGGTNVWIKKSQGL